MAQRRELEYLSRQVGTSEINGSFYSLQRPTSYRAWSEQTPEDFVFSSRTEATSSQVMPYGILYA